jgi:hypothetical protein
MCVIAVYEKNYPSGEDLINMESMNPHYAGIAWRDNGKIKFKKGINAKDIMMTIKEERIQLPFVVHFRITSVGITDKQLNHPFPINESASLELEGESESVLFHNGTWTDYKNEIKNICLFKNVKAPDGLISDSRIMAWVAHHSGANYLGAVIGDSDKVVIFTPTEILKFGKWYDFKKESVSNTYFEKSNDYFGTMPKILSEKKKHKKDKNNFYENFKNLSYNESYLVNELLDYGLSYDEIQKAVEKHGSIKNAYENLKFKMWDEYTPYYGDYG